MGSNASSTPRRGRSTSSARRPASPRLNLSYTYQNNGNVSQIVDVTRGETLNYTYDAFDRLLGVNGSYERTFTYNQLGDLLGKDTLPTFTNPGTTSLKAWWSLDETSGTRRDSYGSNHLTDNNTVGYEQGLQGNAASFVPANQERLTKADNAGLSGGNTDFTLVANVYLNNTTSTYIIMDKSDNASAYDYRLAHNSGTGFRFKVGSSTFVDSGAVTANAWHTVIAWHDSVHDTINIQVDNGTVNTVAFSTGTMDTANPLSIGALPDGTYGLNGRIDEAAIYKRVLTDDERAWLYNNGRGRTYADLTSPPAGPATTYHYTDTDHVHAVTSLSTGESYTYDANGNTLAPARKCRCDHPRGRWSDLHPKLRC